MVLQLENFFEQWDASARPYWIVREGHSAKGANVAKNEDVENMDESQKMLEDCLSGYESGKCTIITKSSPNANNTFSHKVVWGQQTNSRGMRYGGNSGGGNATMMMQMMMMMQQQSDKSNALVMQMLMNSNTAAMEQTKQMNTLQLAAIQKEHQHYKDIQDVLAENGGTPLDEALYGLAGAATPLAYGIANKLFGVPMSNMPVGQPQVGVGSANPETTGAMGVKGGKPSEASEEKAEVPQQTASASMSIDRLYMDCTAIHKAFPEVSLNDLFLRLRLLLEQNPMMLQPIKQQLYAVVVQQKPQPNTQTEDDASLSE